MAIIDGILGIVLRNPFDDKSKFFKKSQYVFGPRFILGTIFAFVGVFGFATSGLVWEFKGIEFGLTTLITSFVALLFSIIFLFPFRLLCSRAGGAMLTKRLSKKFDLAGASQLCFW